MTATITRPLHYVFRAATRNWPNAFADSLLDALGHFDREPAMLTAENVATFVSMWFEHDALTVEEGENDFMVRFAFPTADDAVLFNLRWL